MTNATQAAGGRAEISTRRVLVSLAEAARRTGLSESSSAMARECSRRGLPVVRGRDRARAQVLVDLESFSGERVELELGDITILEFGRLC